MTESFYFFAFFSTDFALIYRGFWARDIELESVWRHFICLFLFRFLFLFKAWAADNEMQMLAK